MNTSTKPVSPPSAMAIMASSISIGMSLLVSPAQAVSLHFSEETTANTSPSATAQFKSFFDKNLITNGDAEFGDTSGWISTGIEVVDSSKAFTIGLPTDTNIGSFSFTGGTGNASRQSLFQVVNISDLATQIDQGLVRSLFSVLLQSRSHDLAQATLTFLGMDKEVLAFQTFWDRDLDGSPSLGFGDWELFEDNRVLPVSTRFIGIELFASRPSGYTSDGFFDNVSLKLVSENTSTSAGVPEPSSMLGLLLAGGVGAGLKARRRRKVMEGTVVTIAPSDS